MGASPFAVVFVFALLLGVPIFIGYLAWNWLHDKDRVNPELCESCGYDLRATPLRCPECGVLSREGRRVKLERLREEWPSNPIEMRRPRIDELPQVIFTTRDRFVADLLRQHLEARGVQCDIQNPASSVSAISGARVYGDYKLMVWSDDVNAAVQIILRLLPAEENLGNVVAPEPA